MFSEAFNSNGVGKRGVKRQESPPDLCQLAKERCDFPNPQKTSRDTDAGYDWFNKRGDY